jgi:hypothetical protein
MVRPVALLAALASVPGCFRGSGRLLLAAAGAAIVSVAIISTLAPPPPRIVVVPPPRPGYVWEHGYWTLRYGVWIWIDGHWIVAQPGYAWSPTHWERFPDGTWRLFPGQWVPAM